MKRILLLLISLGLLFAQVPVVTIADIAGDGANHAIAAAGTAMWITFVAPTTNTNVVRVGDSNISATQGTPVAPGAGLHYPPPLSYPLSQTYYRIASGDKLTIVYQP